MPVRRLLELVRDVKEPGLGKVAALDLQADRQPALVEAAGNRDRAADGQPERIARSTAPLFNTGSTPGSAISTADACVFGAAPNAVDAPEKIFDDVEAARASRAR